jgi:hypothetical protein
VQLSTLNVPPKTLPSGSKKSSEAGRHNIAGRIVYMYIYKSIFPVFFRPICREETKSGVCPKLSRENAYSSCSDECYSDSDCSGDKKCCYNGCGRSCLTVVIDPGVELLGPDEDASSSQQPVDPNSPKIRVSCLFFMCTSC